MQLQLNRMIESHKGTLWYHVTLMGVLLLAVSLRLYANDQPFASSDHAELAAIVTFFYPRDVATLTSSSIPSWQALTSAHGILPLLIGFVSTTLVGIAQFQINEWWWNLPFVLISLITIYLGARFAENLGGRKAGLIAAILIALLPIYAVTSRSSGLAHITLMVLSQILVLWAVLNYSENPSVAHARRTSLAISIALIVDLFFPVLLALITATAGLGRGHTGTLQARLVRIRYLLTRPAVMLLPLIVILCNGALMVAYRFGFTFQGGVFSRLFEGSNRQIGGYTNAFLMSASFAVGPVSLALLIGLMLAAIPWMIRFDRRALPLVWACAYLIPFLLFTRQNISGYLVMGMVALALNAALVLAHMMKLGRSSRWFAYIILVFLIAFLGLRSITIIFPVTLGAVVGEHQAQGGVFADDGLKAAGWWIRSNTTKDDLVFADGRFEPYEIWYYVRRPALAVTDAADSIEPYRQLATRSSQPQLFIVPPDHQQLLFDAVTPPPSLLLVITESDRPILHIYGERSGPVTYLDVRTGNREFDRMFGNADSMFSIGTAP